MDDRGIRYHQGEKALEVWVEVLHRVSFSPLQDDFLPALGSVSAPGTGCALDRCILVFVLFVQMETGRGEIPYFIIYLIGSFHFS